MVRAALKKDMKVLGVMRGYNGLINGDMVEMNMRSVSDTIQRGGTILYTCLLYTSHILNHPHVIVEVGEGHFRLYHPKFSGMAGGVGFLRPEGGAEGVNIAQSHGHALCLKLAGNGEVGGFPKEILGEIHTAILGQRRVFGIQSRHPEHLAGAFAVRSGDQGRVDVGKAALIKKFVDRVGTDRANAEHRLKGVGAGAEVGNGAEKLQGMPFFLERVIWGGRAFQSDLRGVDFIGLLGLRREDNLAGNNDGRADVVAGYVFIIGDFGGLKDHLQVFEAAAVVQLDKTQGFGVPDGLDPAGDGDGFPRLMGNCLLYTSRPAPAGSALRRGQALPEPWAPERPSGRIDDGEAPL